MDATLKEILRTSVEVLQDPRRLQEIDRGVMEEIVEQKRKERQQLADFKHMFGLDR